MTRATYRSKEQARIIAGVLLVGGLVLVAQTVWAYQRSSLWWLAALMNLLLLFLGWRSARARVEASDTGVIVHNPLSTRVVPWSEIREFTIGRHGVFPKIGLIEMVDGSKVQVFGIQAPNPITRPNDQTALRVIDQLNRELRTATHEMRSEDS